MIATEAWLFRNTAIVIDDILDRDIDSKVERTKNRPLVVGSVSVRNAKAFLAALYACDIGILLLIGNH